MLPERARMTRQPWDLAPSAEARWSKYGGGHRACDECVLRRHHGNSSQPPQPARFKRTVGDAAWFLCAMHGQDRRGNDDDAKTAKRLADAGRRTR